MKIRGSSWTESGIIGVGMMARGEVALIVTNKGIENGLINNKMMIMEG